MLQYLKRLKSNRNNLKGRTMNVILCTMQLVGPLVVIVALFICMGQQGLFSLITKSYVTLGTICNVDNSFAATLPKEVFENAKKLNQEGALKIGEDHNSMKKIVKRFKKKGGCSCYVVTSSLVDIWINMWIFIIQNFLVVIFNYFGAHLVLIV